LYSRSDLIGLSKMEYSEFQQRFPLSRRKFWKKVLPKFLGGFLVVLFLTLAGVLAFASSQESFWGSFFQYFLIGLAIWLVPMAIYAIYVKVYIRRYYYDGGPDFLSIKKGVFAPVEIHVQYRKIQDVYVDQDIWDLIFGIYDVHIASATVTSGMEAHIDGVNKESAEGLKQFLLGKISGADTPGSQGLPANQPAAPQAVFDSPERVSLHEFPIANIWVFEQGLYIIWGALVWGVLVGLWAGFNIEDGALGVWIGLAFALIYVIYRMVVTSLWLRNYYFEFTKEYLLVRQGVIAIEERHLPYRSIQNISVNQGVIGRFLGTCVVVIENAATAGYATGSKNQTKAFNGTFLTGQTLPKGNELMRILNDITFRISNPDKMGL
jgi:membrane protein YdbS with pleckstrin-like domain